ncbi:hypothetical protein [Achromobacter deleyi]|uniref:hypothetical protein n=1 Tax=Achromobacter deleyi TaxID=1353891 RepID=UPI0015823EC1|nr:hypothetical protein [Achromobacter deleyi]
MILNAKFPQTISAARLLLQTDIPCICKVGGDFEIEFQAPLPEVLGFVEDWDRDMLDLRVPAGAGGRYTHYAYATLTLKEITKDVYLIVDLKMFDSDFGWCPVIEKSTYASPHTFDDSEDDGK